MKILLILFPFFSFGQVVISIQSDVQNACITFPVYFQSTMNIQPDSVKWDFGNGTTATTQNAIGYYSTVGAFNVSLYVYAHGNEYTVRIRRYIVARYCDCCDPNIKH